MKTILYTILFVSALAWPDVSDRIVDWQFGIHSN